MKILLNRLREEETFDCNYFTPRYYFETEWCLDMHGYIDREELDVRLGKINRIVTANPLLSERAKKGLLYAFAAITFILILFIILAISLLGGVLAPSIITIINTIAFFVGNYLINEEAKCHSERFSEAFKQLFDKYNTTADNPTANWKLKWRNVLTHYKVEMNYTLDNNNGFKGKGKIMPKRITKQQEELERLLASNEDYSIIIDDKKLPKTPSFNYIHTSQPDNTPPFNNTSPFNNTEISIPSVRNTSKY
ncbi:unnamed protein product [Rhizophagus irregularis]|nr:unnamed protein product [Rhizophagus irregularis]